MVSNSHQQYADYKEALLVSVLGALEAIYVPIEIREALTDKSTKVSVLGIASNEMDTAEKAKALVDKAIGVEFGRIIARDIGGSDPERMAPAKVEEYLRETFNGSSIVMDVVAGYEAFEKDYPLFAAVDRCANQVPRHRGNWFNSIIKMENFV